LDDSLESQEKAETGERALYQPIKKWLEGMIASWYVEKEKKPRFQSRPFEFEANPYLEITASGEISPKLKKEFSDETFLILRSEGKSPDIMGFVRRKQSSPRELITVEVKNKSPSLMDVFQARLYQEMFQSTLGFLISSKGITEERVRFIASEKGRFIRGKVIILQFSEVGYDTPIFDCNPRLRDVVPESLRKLFDSQDKR